jgi:hypothetical protein
MDAIPDRHKFAALSLCGTGATFEMPEVLAVSSGLIATRALPFTVTPWWLEQLGKLAAEELKRADLYLLAVAPSKSLSVLDGENQSLEEQCRNFFYGLLIAVPLSTEQAPQLTTGSMESGKATFRQIGRFERPSYIYGTPAPDISSQDMEHAAFYGKEIQSIAGRQGLYGRAVWALNCFMTAVTAGHVYERMRNSVRTMEAFLLPDPGKTERQFKSRTELFLGPKQHDLIATIYSIRSCIEHLHDPLTVLQGDSRTDKLIGLFQKAFVAEAMARYCLQKFLRSPHLRVHFESDSSIGAFWALPETERMRLWGDRLDVSLVERSFDPFLAAQGAE